MWPNTMTRSEGWRKRWEIIIKGGEWKSNGENTKDQPFCRRSGVFGQWTSLSTSSRKIRCVCTHTGKKGRVNNQDLESFNYSLSLSVALLSFFHVPLGNSELSTSQCWNNLCKCPTRCNPPILSSFAFANDRPRNLIRKTLITFYAAPTQRVTHSLALIRRPKASRSFEDERCCCSSLWCCGDSSSTDATDCRAPPPPSALSSWSTPPRPAAAALPLRLSLWNAHVTDNCGDIGFDEVGVDCSDPPQFTEKNGGTAEEELIIILLFSYSLVEKFQF